MNIIWYDTIDSTNSEALRKLPELEDMTVLAAREQTAGRGQRGNTWFSEPGTNLTFSIVLKQPGIPVKNAFWLNYLMSEVVVTFLRGCGVMTQVKWPNDVYVGKKKICGILIETTCSGDNLSSAVIGVGVNINQREFPQLANATSLWRCVGETFGLEECLDKLMDTFQRYLPMLQDENRRNSLFASYSNNLFKKDVNARYHDLLEDREYWGILKGVESDGRLHILDLDANKDRYYRFKEVSFIL